MKWNMTEISYHLWKKQQPDSQLGKDSVQAVPGTFLWSLLVKTWNFTRSQENSGTEPYGVPTRQGNYEIFPRDDQLPHQVLCTQCTPCSTLSALRHQAADYKPKCILTVSTD